MSIYNLGPRRIKTGGSTTVVTKKDASFTVQTNIDLTKVTLTPATAVTATSGFNAKRGEINLTSGKTLNGTSYFTGVYGRANIFGTVAIGSGDLAAVYGKMDFNGATLTSGHVAPVQSNIVNVPASAAIVDLFYGESAHGNHINSMFNAYAACNYAFDLSEVSPGTIVTASAGSSASKYLRVKLNGTAYKIALLADA